MTTTVTLVSTFVDKEASLPQVVIPLPKKDRRFLTFNGKDLSGYFNIDIIADTQSVQRTLLDEIEAVIFDNEVSLGVDNVTMTQSDGFRLDVGNKSAHTVSLTFDFRDVNIG